MLNTPPLPYYHPTTVAIIDDNMDFMINFSLQLDEKLAFTMHPSPTQALNYINNYTNSVPLAQKYVSAYSDFIGDEAKENIIVIDTTQIISEISNPNRFRENSIVIVDYAMPHMNGVDFCKMLNNQKIKKILLTGVADEKTAIQAFNDGVIDKFIKKSDKDAITLAKKYIDEFQAQYFQEKTSFIKNTLNNDIYGFMLQPHFIETFNKICSKYDIVEYYLTSTPPGYLLIDAVNNYYHLITLSEHELESHADVIRDQRGPSSLYSLVKEKEVIPNFFPLSNYYINEITDWKKYTFPASPLFTTPTYYYTIIESPSYYEKLISDTISYSRYLRTIDENQLN